jgi:hypothetical protein
MKIKNVVVFVVVLFATIMLSATETRVASMGGVGFYMKDNSNVFAFPGTFNSYQGMVISELRVKNSDTSYSAGIHFPSNFGVYLNNPVTVNLPSSFEYVTIDNTMDLFYGLELTNYDLGVRIAYGLDSYLEEIPGTNLEEREAAHYYSLSVGISYENMDLGVNFELPGTKYEFDNEERTWGGFGLGLNYRSFLDRGKMQFVPVATFKISTTKYEYDTGVTGADVDETDYSDLSFGIGVGLNYKLSDQNLLVVGLEPFGMNSSKTEVKNGSKNTNVTMVLPGVYAGVESQIKSWLTGRFGLAQTFRIETETTKPYEEDEFTSSVNYKDFALTFGLGFKFGKFSLDAYVNEGLLFDGPNFISGTDQPIASKLSLTYDFE